MSQDLSKSSAARTERRLLSGFAAALAIALSSYLVVRLFGGGWFGSVWFLGLLPGTLCALICYIGDPDQNRSGGFYFLVPVALVATVIASLALIVREGVICLAMMSPIWLVTGWAGAFLLRNQRRRARSARTLQSSFLIVPMMAAMVEAQIPVPHEQVLLSRSVLVLATPAEIWPNAVASRSIGPHEGRWNITQNIIGVARPRGIELQGKGVGAVRTAYWGDHIHFEERITAWAPCQKLAWAFNFANSSLAQYTDEHISPDGQFLKIDTGDYTITPIALNLTKLTLNTRYIAKTHVNPYAKWWGELLLGDVQNNVLAIIKDRSEAAHVKVQKVSSS
jgi:hypothetical protein